MKNVAVSLMAIFFAACSGNKSPHSLQQEKEDLSAKGLLQGIWLDDETESPLMRVEGDTIYYADVQSTPIAFKIIRDTLYTYENDTTTMIVYDQMAEASTKYVPTGSDIAAGRRKPDPRHHFTDCIRNNRCIR